MVVPALAKVDNVEPGPGKKVELLKCLPLENLVEKIGKKLQLFRFLACVLVADGKGPIGIGEHISKSRELSEKKAGEVALQNFRFLWTKVNYPLEGKCNDVKVTIKPDKYGSGCKGSPLATRVFELMGMVDYDVFGADNTLSYILAINKALLKIK